MISDISNTDKGSLVCPGCSCLCDDVAVSSSNNRDIYYLNYCVKGHQLFTDHSSDAKIHRPMIHLRGEDWKEVGYQEAVDRTSQLLKQARRPLLYGLSQSGCETQESAINLAMALDGEIEIDAPLFWESFLNLAGDFGMFRPTLDEIRDNAELVVLLGDDFYESHPRLLGRYAVFPRGKYIERGHKDRTVLLLERRTTDLRKIANQFAAIEERPFNWAIKTIIKIIEQQDINEPNANIVRLRIMADAMKRARYGVLFFSMNTTFREPEGFLRSLFYLSKILNVENRFALFPLDSGFNCMGAIHQMISRTGSPLKASFRAGRNDFSDKAMGDSLKDGHDVILMIDPKLEDNFPARFQGNDAKVILLLSNSHDYPSSFPDQAHIVIHCAMPGIASEEVAYRMDGLPVRLPGILASDVPSQWEIVDRVSRQVRAG